jgi:NAD-dependent SIR2 family protein deacetylase
LVVSRHGEVIHVRCVTEVLDSKAVQQANRAATLLEGMTRFPTCAACHEPIRGDYVRRHDGKAVHVTCPAAKG